MSGPCSTQGIDERYLETSDNFGYGGGSGKIILKWI
jgi:hypothetical protein